MSDNKELNIWTGKRMICCNSSMALWYALNAVPITCGELREVTRQEYKDIVRAFPKNTNNCRCKECRYFRMTKV